jgi:outer membrane protein OmpA-like peptidoglycan-associated protein
MPAPAAPAPVASAPAMPATPAPMTPTAQPPAPPSVAAVPLAPTAPPKDRALQIEFAAGDSRVPAASQAGLKELAESMKAQESLRLQIVAYAAGGDLTASTARRLSLSRALAVRTVLIEQGVRSTRIDVRALGDKVSDQPANRVDLSFGDR